MINQSKEFFINMKPSDIPNWIRGKHWWEQEVSAIDFFENEMNKIRNGVTINGVFIHPWLYFHCNFFKTPIPQPDKSEPIINPPLRDNEWYMAENYQMAQEKGKSIFLFGSRRFAKALEDNEALYYTDNIKRPIGSAKVGDEIIGGDGKPTKIIGVYPQGTVDLFTVTLADGREVKCCDEHLWEVFDLQAGAWKTLPLKEIRKRYKYLRTSNGKEKEVINYYLPINGAIERPEVELPIPPYILGCWLGDGTSKLPSITSDDEEIINYFRNYATTLGLDVRKEDDSYYLTLGKHTGGHTKNPFTKLLIELDLIGNKHIPDIYLNSSVEQRKELLRGLMDTDGTISKSGNGISFSQVNCELSNDFYKLTTELGIHTRLYPKTGNYVLKSGKLNTYNKIVIFPNFNPFKLSRKANRYKNIVSKTEQLRRERVGIVDIRESGKSKATCIRVDNKDKLFLTTNCVVTHNSVMESSILLWNSITRENTTNDITCGTKLDLNNIANFLRAAVTEMHPAISLPTIKKQWESKVIFGYKEGGTEQEIIHSQISLTNAEEGNSSASEKGAGGAPGCVIIDEVGKFSFLSYYLGLLPALATPTGMKAVVLLSGTGGNQTLSADAFKVLSNPEPYKILPMNWDLLENKISDPEQITWKRKMFGMYVPPQMAYEEGLIKVSKLLSHYLGVEKDPFLDKIKIDVTDWKLARNVLTANLKSFEKDRLAYDKERMYHPMDPDDCFLAGTENPFPANVARLHKQKLEAEGDVGRNVELRRAENGHFNYHFSDKKICTFPFEGGVHDAPIVLYGDLPTEKPEYGEFVSGLDPYKQQESSTDSVGSLYVIQRKTDIEMPTELIKLSYASRPSRFVSFYVNCEYSIEAFNAQCMMENADQGFLQYLDNKNKAHELLAEGTDWSKLVNPNSKPKTKFGFYPTAKNNDYLLRLAIDYANDEIVVGQDENGVPIIKYGVEFIPDPELLQEMIDFGRGGNFDRIRSFGAALAWARYLDKLNVVPRNKNRDIKGAAKKRANIRNINRGFIPLKKKI